MQRVYTTKDFPDSQYSQHFRVMTYRKPDGTTNFYDLCQYIEKNNKEFKSNAGDVKYDLDPNIHPIVKKGVDQAVMLHGSLPPFAVAWDFMVTKDGPAFLEGNVVFGGLASYHTERYHQRFDRFLTAFKEFYNHVTK